MFARFTTRMERLNAPTAARGASSRYWIWITAAFWERIILHSGGICSCYCVCCSNWNTRYFAFIDDRMVLRRKCMSRSRLRSRRQKGRSSSPATENNFLFSTSSRPTLGPTQAPIQWVPGVKRPGSEADHSPSTSIKVKNTWIYTFTPPIHLHGVVLNKLSTRTTLPLPYWGEC
jgi:hypothetical protein